MGKIVEFGRRPQRRRRHLAGHRRGRGAPVWLPLAVLVAGAGALYVGTSEFNLSPFAPAAETIHGRATVVDGDTIEVAGQRVRFNGIDAPESSQQCEDSKGFRYQCGSRAAEALDEFLAQSRPIRCEFAEWDQYGRFVGDCFRSDGLNVAAWLVENGHALDWPKYSGGAYAGQQVSARAAKRGIWSGSFQEPWAWRGEHQPAEQSISSPPFSVWSSDCNIKGNISDKGERIYHVPGQAYYDETRISTGKGERWFCSEQEARNAGWRRARR
ncbi:thermonuclease family protein [Aminobacter sp. LjRoot7]|uniref:thermonuclease family protein n=1 Tax=Aminobacter sp. LjRoot7 TaxID=3342335 RepID=UPI003ECE8494